MKKRNLPRNNPAYDTIVVRTRTNACRFLWEITEDRKACLGLERSDVGCTFGGVIKAIHGKFSKSAHCPCDGKRLGVPYIARDVAPLRSKFGAIMVQESQSRNDPEQIQSYCKNQLRRCHVGSFSKALLELHPGWSYTLWTDQDNIALLKERHPELESVYAEMPQYQRCGLTDAVHIYGAVRRLCLDLDYKFLRAFDLNDKTLVLPRESDRRGGSLFLSGIAFLLPCPEGHPFWKALLDAIRLNPPTKDPSSKRMTALSKPAGSFAPASGTNSFS